jgi:hypothetical protein
VNRSETLQPGPWLKTPGWRFGAWLLGIAVLAVLVDWITGDAVDLGWRVYLVMLLGFLISVPYGVSWIRGQAPPPPQPATLVPQAQIQGEGTGNTYVLVGPTTTARFGLGRKPKDLGPIAWFFYSVFWRWPLVAGDAILTAAWRGINRLFGFNGGPRRDHTSGHIDYPDDLPPPDRDMF